MITKNKLLLQNVPLAALLAQPPPEVQERWRHVNSARVSVPAQHSRLSCCCCWCCQHTLVPCPKACAHQPCSSYPRHHLRGVGRLLRPSSQQLVYIPELAPLYCLPNLLPGPFPPGCLTTGLSQGTAAAGQEGHKGPLLHHPPSCKAQGATHAAVPQALHSNRCRTCCTNCCSSSGGSCGGCGCCCGWQLPAAHNQPCEPHRRVCGSITRDRSLGPRPSSSSSGGGGGCCSSTRSSGVCTLCADKAAQHVSGPARQRQWQQQLHGAVQQPAEQLPQ